MLDNGIVARKFKISYKGIVTMLFYIFVSQFK